MCELVLIFSRCEKKVNKDYQFHFKGYYQGHRIKNLLAQTLIYQHIELHQNYLLWSKKLELNNGVLRVKIIKYKKIN